MSLNIIYLKYLELQRCKWLSPEGILAICLDNGQPRMELREMSNSKPLPPGMRVRVAQDARIVGLVDKSNPYWYVVECPSGEQEAVNMSRLTWFADDIKATMDHDGSVVILSNRLTPKGARELLLWLQTHTEDFETMEGSAQNPEPTA
jgi:hypothetical protein